MLPRLCFSEATHTAAHEKQMPFVAGEAPGRPRCQGRVVFAFIGAKRRHLIRRWAVQAQVLAREGQEKDGLENRKIATMRKILRLVCVTAIVGLIGWRVIRAVPREEKMQNLQKLFGEEWIK